MVWVQRQPYPGISGGAQNADAVSQLRGHPRSTLWHNSYLKEKVRDKGTVWLEMGLEGALKGKGNRWFCGMLLHMEGSGDLCAQRLPLGGMISDDLDGEWG